MPLILAGSGTISASSGNTGISIDSSGRVTQPNIPIFQAYGVSSGTFATNNYWIFPTTLVNIGNHYNASTGRFTAPVNGTYQFFWSHIGGNSDTVWRYFFRRNLTNVGDWHLRLDTGASGSDYEFGTRQIIITLAAGDSCSIFFTSDSGTSSYPSGNSLTDTYPTFGGYLIG